VKELASRYFEIENAKSPVMYTSPPGGTSFDSIFALSK
jgi:hypothetical protein